MFLALSSTMRLVLNIYDFQISRSDIYDFLKNLVATGTVPVGTMTKFANITKIDLYDAVTSSSHKQY